MKRFSPFAGRSKRRSWFWWGINVGIFLAILAWWWLENQADDSVLEKFKVKSLVFPDDEPEEIPVPELEHAPEVEPEPDDLRRIEGIGPKSAAALQNAGITTFAQLADMQPVEIKKALTEAGIRIGFPETWPEQAALAAADEWEELEALQDSLSGGRRL